MTAWAGRLRLAALAIAYGTVAGALAQLTLQGMTSLQQLIWAGPAPRWRIVATILLGGILLIGLRRVGEPLTMAQLLRADPGDRARRHRIIITTAATGIVSIGFGGAIGPEAGLLAVIAEVSAIIGYRITRDVEEQRMLRSAATAGALGGLYASPPGAAAADDGMLGPQKILQILAGVAGFFAFMFCSRVVFGSDGIAAIELPGGHATWAIAAAAAIGTAAGYGFQWLHHLLLRMSRRIPSTAAVTMLGTLAFALLAAALPSIRFSGHHEIEDLLGLLPAGDAAPLLLLGAAKILALALCLAAGWRGGEFFPLIFIGAAVGAGTGLLLGSDPGPAMAAGLAAAVVAGWGKPLAAFLVIILFVTGAPVLALLAGVGVGWAAIALLPLPQPAADEAKETTSE